MIATPFLLSVSWPEKYVVLPLVVLKCPLTLRCVRQPGYFAGGYFALDYLELPTL